MSAEKRPARHRPIPNQTKHVSLESLSEALDRLEREDPEVARTATALRETIATMVMKAATDWPGRRIFHPGPAGCVVEVESRT